jgi:hypothetical protein
LKIWAHFFRLRRKPGFAGIPPQRMAYGPALWPLRAPPEANPQDLRPLAHEPPAPLRGELNTVTDNRLVRQPGWLSIGLKPAKSCSKKHYQLFSAHCSFMLLQNPRSFWNSLALLQALSYVFIAF